MLLQTSPRVSPRHLGHGSPLLQLQETQPSLQPCTGTGHTCKPNAHTNNFFFKKMLLNVPRAEGLSVGLFNLRLPLDLKSACLGLPNTAIRAFRTTSDFLLLCKKENPLCERLRPGWGTERGCLTSKSPSFIALPHPQAFKQEVTIPSL